MTTKLEEVEDNIQQNIDELYNLAFQEGIEHHRQKVRDVLLWMQKNPNKYGNAIEYIRRELDL